MATTPPPLTPFGGLAPQRSDKTTFSARFDAFITWFIACVTQFIAIAANVYANAQEAFVSAGTATSAASAALATANAVPWVSGATVAQYAAVISPTDGGIYRRMTATGSGTTDPRQDSTNYAALSSLPTSYMKVSDRRASGTSAGNATGLVTVRTLNSIEWNDISGASLASNQVTLPAGTYEVYIRCPAYGLTGHQARLQNVTDSSLPLIGSSQYAAASTTTSDSVITGRFTISAAKVFQVQHYAQASTSALGNAVGSGQVEVYTEAIFKKVA